MQNLHTHSSSRRCASHHEESSLTLNVHPAQYDGWAQSDSANELLLPLQRGRQAIWTWNKKQHMDAVFFPSLFHFLLIHLSHSISYTCTKPNGVTTHQTCARTHTHTHSGAHTTYTPPRHLSVQRPVSLALGAVGSKGVKEKVSLGSVLLNPTSSLLSPAVLVSIKQSHDITLPADGPSPPNVTPRLDAI